MLRVIVIFLLLSVGIIPQIAKAQNHSSASDPNQRKVAAKEQKKDDKENSLQRFEVSKPLMGVKFRFVIYAESLAQARRGMIAAIERIQELEECMSDYDPDSELSKLTRECKPGASAKVSKELFEILELCDQIHTESKGSFDPTIGPLSKLWRIARKAKKIPTEEQINEARKRVGWRRLRLDKKEQSITFDKKGMELDLGGIAKGYAADEAIRVLADLKLPICLVDAGGDVTVGNPPPGRKGWNIAIANAAGEKLTIANASVATSGDQFQFLEHKGKRYSHIVDPKTGWGVVDRRLVTVVSQSTNRPGARADGWASALSVMQIGNFQQSRLGRLGISGVQVMRVGDSEPEPILTSGLLEKSN